MKRKPGWRYALGAALLLAVAAVILAAFSLMSRTDKADRSLAESADERFGWRYELLVDGSAIPFEPEFPEASHVPELPEETEAVRITRTMTEDIPHAELEWSSYLDGVEVFWNGELLHSDFLPEVPRGDDGFLRPDAEEWGRIHKAQGGVWRRVRMTLPADYLGGELSVVTYFPEDWGTPVPEYPSIGSEDSLAAESVVFSVKYDAAMTIYAALALLIAAMFLLDIPNAGADAKTLLLCLYFLLLFLQETNYSYASYYSELGTRMQLNVLGQIYIAPLYLYLALQLRKRWRYPLCAVIVVWALYEGVVNYLGIQRGVAYRIGPWAFVVLLAVVAALCADGIGRSKHAGRDVKRAALYLLTVTAVLAFHLFSRIHAWGSARKYLVLGVWEALRVGSFEPLVSVITDSASTLALIAVVTGFVRRTLRTRQEVSVLQERTRQTMESYNRLLAAEGATNALHHEMRHHMTALSGILKSGDVARAARYADAVAGDLDRLPTGRYSRNLLVDVIAGSFLDRARARGIHVEHRLSVPPELDIGDEDLSVFLSNVLQNALEACERMGDGAKRYIRVEMRLRGKFLFICCVNSAPEDSGEVQSRPGHGYGLAAMEKIAEKYNSALVIERGPGEFSVKSDLCLSAR